MAVRSAKKKTKKGGHFSGYELQQKGKRGSSETTKEGEQSGPLEKRKGGGIVHGDLKTLSKCCDHGAWGHVRALQRWGVKKMIKKKTNDGNVGHYS